MKTNFIARCIAFCILEIVLHNVNDVSCVAAIKHEFFSSIAFCTPKVGRRNVNDVSFVATYCVVRVLPAASVQYFQYRVIFCSTRTML